MTTRKRVLAVIMGGGRGTRLQPLTAERCKPAVPLAGKYRLVDIPISNCINSEINRMFLLTQFNTASLHRHIRETYHFDAFGGGFVEVLAAEQTEKSVDWYQGTADAVRRNLNHFRVFDHDLVLILSGDQLYKMDFRELIDAHIASGADVTLSAIPVPVSKVEGLGLMKVNDALEIEDFAEKPSDPAVIEGLALSPKIEKRLHAPTIGREKHCLASMGIYLFNRKALTEALDNTMADFGKEVIPSLRGRKKLCAHIFEGYWEDIGTVKAFYEANLALAQPLPPFNFFDPRAPVYTLDRYLPPSKINLCTVDNIVVGDGSILSNGVLTHCVFGLRSFVADGCALEDVVLMGADFYETPDDQAENKRLGRPNIGVGKNCTIRGAIIDKNARVGDGCTLDATGKADGRYAAGAVIVRDGVLVVPRGGIVPPNTVV
ncbi:glucose-1-phosphate adenylyltransferase [Cephaloticoccus capnophilus]|uniref:Glucose-1-phosphate adenylyltransferase n=1 Tax=Cephaloticoccus capnophilus TaxID=1548208 RepID=A0A139SS95_9BACT|nr:glucose-1-phosphate adenylyltransferase [Cephaloticoccus capnophilus]KXU37402.1 glucose-1-phosphate adenylyltransferase [Cephaloticoccus capnophilus]